MEEKQPIKISLSTFLLIIAIIIIVVMGYFIYKMYNEKISSQEEANRLSNEIIDLEQKINSISTIIDSINTNNSTETNNEKILSETEARALLYQNYKLAGDLYYLDPAYFIYANEGEFINGEYYIKLNNYNEVLKNNFTSRMWDDFEENAVCLVIIDGVAYIAEGGAGFVSYAGVEAFENITIEEDKISATVKTKHNDVDGNFNKYEKSTFTLKKDGENWLIDEFNSEDVTSADLD